MVSCKKTPADGSAETDYVIKVKEYKTETPLQGVKISLYTCSRYDAVFGCQQTALFASHVTDAKGEYTITGNELTRANEGIVLSKTQYWERNGGTGENLLEPEAWVNLSLKAKNSYPDTSFFALRSTGALGISSIQTFKAPGDSVVRFRLFGNETNEANWIVYTMDPVCYQFCKIDTLASGVVSLNPKKFETLSASLNY